MPDAVEDLKAAAHDYRSRGWRVIQLHRMLNETECSCIKRSKCGRSAGKHPRDNEWQNTEPYSAADLETLWDSWNWNIGIATGSPSGLWVLDIDPDGGGMETMAALVAEHGPLPETFVVQTGSGGYHYYFALPDFELRNSQGRIGKGIDTRADGGQVVAPPSVSGKGVYTVVADAPLAQAPDWILEAARKTVVDPTTVVTAVDLPKPEDLDPAEWERCNRYAKSIVDAELARLDALTTDGWNGAGWNHTTFEVSCSLLEIGNSPWNAYTADHARRDVLARAPRDDEGFDDYIVNRTLESAATKIGDQARPVPIDRSAEPDPLFESPDVRRRPTEGGGDETDPVVGRQVDNWFFEGKDLLAAKLANAVADKGPVGWGLDHDFWSYDDGVWTHDHYLVEDRCIRLLGDQYRVAHKNNTSGIVRLHAQALSADPDPGRINFLNGVLDWRTGDLLDHDPKYGSTVQLPVAYEPHLEPTCPKFDAFLADVMHEDYVDLTWEMIGYLMMSGNPHQVAFMLYGGGGNGKGTLLRVIQALLGHRNLASESLDDLSGNRFRSANLFGKIANIAGDIDATYQEHTAMFKKVTGEDMITAERKNMDPFQFECWAVPLFSANKFPGSADVTTGYLRRWVVLHFHKQITNVVPGLSNLLLDELPGIAVKAIPALRRVMDRERFDPQGEATKGIEMFSEAIDQVRQWVASGIPLQSPDGTAMLMDLYASYVLWAERSGRRKVTETEFSHRLEATGYPVERIAGLEYHRGLHVPPTVSTTLQTRTPATMFDD